MRGWRVTASSASEIPPAVTDVPRGLLADPPESAQIPGDRRPGWWPGPLAPLEEPVDGSPELGVTNLADQRRRLVVGDETDRARELSQLLPHALRVQYGRPHTLQGVGIVG